jgi:hypothetical protein
LLILQPVIAGMRAEARIGQEPEDAQTVVERHDDLVPAVREQRVVAVAVAFHEPSAGDAHQHRQATGRSGAGWPGDVDEQAVLAAGEIGARSLSALVPERRGRQSRRPLRVGPRIWYQSFTDPEVDVPYFTRLAGGSVPRDIRRPIEATIRA